jgi:three-Cys-motif partner protein
MPTGESRGSSDGQLAIRVHPWAKDKLFYIKNICDIFNMGMKNIWPIRTYIDLFAGPGICIVEETGEEIPGSPLIALRCKPPFTHYFFNDLNPAFTKSLQLRAASCGFTNVNFFSKDCNSVIADLLQKLPADSLDLCFIDPLNWEIDFNSIRNLTKNRRMDLAITFHVGSIKRVAHNPPQELIDFFPDRSWQQEYEKAAATGKLRGNILLEAYKRGLANLEYKYIRDHVLERNNRNVPLYHLIYASKHPRGTDFWDKITMRSSSGQLRMPMVREKGNRREGV